MSLSVLLVTATSAEADAFRNITGIKELHGRITYRVCEFQILITGVGANSTSWAMTKWFNANPVPDLVINTGIAGSYRDGLTPGEVVVPVSDCFADSGIETVNGFQTLFEAGIEDPERFPFRNGKIFAENRFVTLATKQLKSVSAVTVNTATGSAHTIRRILEKFNPDIETMEGATFFYICNVEKVPFLALRAVSNKVEPRDKKKWNIPLAIDNLSEKLKVFIQMLE
jgi:futalosine hydrolase